MRMWVVTKIRTIWHLNILQLVLTFLQYLGNVNTFPHMGLVGFTGPRVLPNENLKPQNQSSFEVGA